MEIKKWKKLKTKRVYDNFKKMDVETFLMPDGKTKDFDIASNKSNAVISVVGLTKNKDVILIKQYRPGPEKIFYEFPLGLVEKGEDVLSAAKREFLEETGHIGNFKKVGVEYVSAYSKVAIHCFLALDCEKKTDKLTLDEGEFIEVHLFSLEKVKEMLKRAEIRNFGEGYLALDNL